MRVIRCTAYIYPPSFLFPPSPACPAASDPGFSSTFPTLCCTRCDYTAFFRSDFFYTTSHSLPVHLFSPSLCLTFWYSVTRILLVRFLAGRHLHFTGRPLEERALNCQRQPKRSATTYKKLSPRTFPDNEGISTLRQRLPTPRVREEEMGDMIRDPSPAACATGAERPRPNQLFLGTFVHSRTKEELEYLHDTAVCVDAAGTIVAVEAGCGCLARAEEVLFPRLGWTRGEVLAHEAKEGEFFFPGFIGEFLSSLVLLSFIISSGLSGPHQRHCLGVAHPALQKQKH